jgi:hypothetical protein
MKLLQAIVKARTIPRYFQIDKSAKSFAFFATPHRGGMGAGFGQKAAGLVRVFGSNPRNDILEVLRKDSQAAPTIHDDFVDGQDDYHVCTFFECRPMPLQRSLVGNNSKGYYMRLTNCRLLINHPLFLVSVGQRRYEYPVSMRIIQPSASLLPKTKPIGLSLMKSRN